jgi:predicted permease
MTTLSKFIFFQFLILIPFIIGYTFKERLSNPEIISRNLIKFNLIFIDPVIVFWTVWGLAIEMDMIFLPLSGLFLVIISLGLGYLSLPILRLDKKKSVTFLISSSLSNHGFTLGGFLCYIFLGEQGLGLSFIFISYFMIYLFLFIFPLADLSTRGNINMVKNARAMIFSLKNMPLYAVCLALFLHLPRIMRPSIEFPIDLFLIISIAVYYLSLGMSFSFHYVKEIKRENLILSLIKFILIPLITLLILMQTGFSGAIKSVIAIQSFMPVAIYSVVTAILFGLDSRLASGLFVINTIIFLTIVLPLLFIMRSFILNL